MVLFHYTRGISGFRFTTPEAFGRFLITLGAMGRALLAPDIEAGPKYPAGSLIFREQFASVTSNDLLAHCWMTDFENSPPIRRVAAYKGQRNFAGLWWCVTTQRHVGFESWLKRDHLVRLDFDATVTGISSQPFKIKLPEPLPQA